METKRLAELELSRLMLGTVQFGLNYGIANTAGQPSYETARDIVACAIEGGVNCFDTAAAYGTSEEVLGKIFRELGVRDTVVVVSKIPAMAESGLPSGEAAKFVEESVAASLRRLGLDFLPVCLFHNEENFSYIETLLKLKEKGLVRHVGCSVMTPEATGRIIATGLAEAVQIPSHVMDHRFTGSEILIEARNRQTAIFVRSVYFQGLLLMPEERIPAALHEVIPVRRRLESLARTAGLTMSELAMRYILGIDGIACVLVGVDNAEQMRENLAIFERGPLEATLQQEVVDAVPVLPDTILLPTLWPKR